MLNPNYFKKFLFGISILSILFFLVFSYKIQVSETLKMKTELPRLEISCPSPDYSNPKSYLVGLVSLSFPDERGNLSLEGMQIRLRGNGTLYLPKHPYKIKFDEKQALIPSNQSAAKDWILLANYTDFTMMRNYYALECMKGLDHILFAPDSIFVELTMNGKYKGVYQLCEAIEFDEARIDISDKYEFVQNGVLIERDLSGLGTPLIDIVNVDDVTYSIKSDIHSIEQGQYVQDTLQEVRDAIYSGDQEEIQKVMDIDSCIDVYLLYEFTKNLDVGWGSFYMYLYPNNSTLYFGTPWDFDLALGNDIRLDRGSYEGLYVGNIETDFQQSHDWYQKLMNYSWYQKLVLKRWNEVKHIFLEKNAEILEVSSNYRTAFDRDQDLWLHMKEYDNPYDLRPEAFLGFTTYEEHINYLVKWIENRYIWLDHYFNEEMSADHS